MKFFEKVARKVMGRPVREETPHSEYMRLELEIEEIGVGHGLSLAEMKSMSQDELREALKLNEYNEMMDRFRKMSDLWYHLTEDERSYHKEQEQNMVFGWQGKVAGWRVF